MRQPVEADEVVAPGRRGELGEGTVSNTQVQLHGGGGRRLHRSGDHVVTTEFPVNILPPGQFTFTIAAWQMPGEMVQMLERCMTVTVSSTPFDPDHRFEVAGSPAASVRAAWHAESSFAGA